MPTYQVWMVYGNKGITVSYVVVNVRTKELQSAGWKTYSVAKEVCDDLNVLEAETVSNQ